MLILDPTPLYAALAFASLINKVIQKYKANEHVRRNTREAHTPEEFEPLIRGLPSTTLAEPESDRAYHDRQ
ncbi:hypothetical protein [Anaplasma bovis]|uniref:hypothetical protein n=1 Tax=Anaplasma bovis TaxID=186733 RepID=UPI002FF1C8AD